MIWPTYPWSYILSWVSRMLSPCFPATNLDFLESKIVTRKKSLYSHTITIKFKFNNCISYKVLSDPNGRKSFWSVAKNSSQNFWTTSFSLLITNGIISIYKEKAVTNLAATTPRSIHQQFSSSSKESLKASYQEIFWLVWNSSDFTKVVCFLICPHLHTTLPSFLWQENFLFLLLHLFFYDRETACI